MEQINKIPDLTEQLRSLNINKKLEPTIKQNIEDLIEADKNLTDLFNEIIKDYPDEDLIESINKLNYSLFNLQKTIIQENCLKLLDEINEKHKDQIKKLVDDFNNKIQKMEQLIKTKGEKEKQIIEESKEEIVPSEPTEQEELFTFGIDGLEQNQEGIYDNKIKTENISTRIFEDPMSDIEEFLRVIPDAFNRKSQMGGTKKEEIVNDLIKRMKSYYDYYEIYNGDLILKVATMINEPEKLAEALKGIAVESKREKSISNVIQLFFIILGNKEQEILALDNRYLNRDTKLYKRYSEHPIYGKYIKIQNNEKCIFVYKLIEFLYDRTKGNPTWFFRNKESSEYLINLFRFFSNHTLTLKDIYKQLLDQEGSITQYYEKYIDDTKKIYTFVKIRSNEKGNPRYNIKIRNNKKDLFVRYCNTDKKINTVEEANMNSNSKEYYYFGPFDKIYSQSELPSQISKDSKMDLLIKKLVNGDDLCVIGYGQSGAGKTSSLIYLDNGKDSQNGILIELCNDQKIKNEFDKLEVTMINIFMRYDMGIHSSNFIENKHYDSQPINIDGSNSLEFFYDEKLGWTFEKDKNIQDETEKRGLGKMIKDGLEKRLTEPTPNNPNSSRSHVLVIIKMYGKKGNSKKDFVNLVICDFAGIENVFNCEDTNELIQFEKKYNEVDKFINLNKSLCENESINKGNMIQSYNDIVNKMIKFSKIILCKPIKTKELNKNVCENIDDPLKSQCQNVEHKIIDPSLDLNIFSLNQDNINQNEINYVKDKYNFTDEYETIRTVNDIKEKARIMYSERDLEKRINDYKKLYYILCKSLEFSKQNKFNKSTPKNNKEELRKLLDQSRKDYDIETQISTNNLDYMRDELKKDPISREITNPLKLLNMDASTEERKANFPTKFQFEAFYGERINMEPINKIHTVLNEFIEQTRKILLSFMCQYLKLLKLKYNCNLRVNEGYLINRSLSDLRKSVKQLFLQSIEKDNLMPLVYVAPGIPYCRNSFIYDNYDEFYVNASSDINSKIFQIFNDYKIDTKQLTFVIFTVINLNISANNPPSIPFINVNDLKYYNMINNKNGVDDGTRNKLMDVKTNLNSFSFYIQNYKNIKNNGAINKLMNDSIQDTSQNYITNLVNEIEILNTGTLIGSLESTDAIRNLFNDKFICAKNTIFNQWVERFKNEFKLTEFVVDGKKMDINEIDGDLNKYE